MRCGLKELRSECCVLTPDELSSFPTRRRLNGKTSFYGNSLVLMTTVASAQAPQAPPRVHHGKSDR